MSGRDRRFVAVHRGGPLERDHHALLATWAADCAEHVLELFTNSSEDDRPAKAIATARAWARGEIRVGAAQAAAVAAHAAAREASTDAAVAVARAAGHAVATAHAADHSLGAPYYALKAVAVCGGDVEAELQWELERIPPAVRSLVLSGLERKFPKLFSSGAPISRSASSVRPSRSGDRRSKTGQVSAGT